MTHIKQRLPLRTAEQTPSRIDTADGQSVSISWMNTTHQNPYGEAEEFAAYIVRAVNNHDGLAQALAKLLANAVSPEDYSSRRTYTLTCSGAAIRDAILALEKVNS